MLVRWDLKFKGNVDATWSRGKHSGARCYDKEQPCPGFEAVDFRDLLRQVDLRGCRKKCKHTPDKVKRGCLDRKIQNHSFRSNLWSVQPFQASPPSPAQIPTRQQHASLHKSSSLSRKPENIPMSEGRNRVARNASVPSN